jgi:Protein of unknown function (DUF1559)
MRLPKLLATVGLVLLIFGGGLLLLRLPCPQGRSDSDVRLQSAYNVKSIGLALHGYHDTYRKLPPAVVRDKNGKPLYSWRVALLPFLEQNPLYQKFQLDEPWDSPHNKSLLEPTPRCYATPWPDDPPGTTRYQGFTGPGTAFERDGLTLKDFPDGLSDTIVVVESGGPVPWAKPADIAYDPKGPLPPLGAGFSKRIEFLCVEVGRVPAFNACFADGSLRFIASTTDEQTIRSLITRNGGETVDWSKVQ